MPRRADPAARANHISVPLERSPIGSEDTTSVRSQFVGLRAAQRDSESRAAHALARCGINGEV